MIVLDTHAWIWWASDQPKTFSPTARKILEEAPEICVCAISCWELGMLVAKGRLDLDRDPLLWIQQALAHPRTLLLPLSPEIAVQATRLEGTFHGDPADCMIAATCLEYRAQLVTKDQRLRRYRPLSTLW